MPPLLRVGEHIVINPNYAGIASFHTETSELHRAWADVVSRVQAGKRAVMAPLVAEPALLGGFLRHLIKLAGGTLQGMRAEVMRDHPHFHERLRRVIRLG